MLSLEFPGARQLIAAVDAAVVLPDEAATTDALRNALCKLIRNPDVQLPACVFEREDDHYARRELYLSEEHGYSVVAMTWDRARARRSTTTPASGVSKASGRASSRSRHTSWSNRRKVNTASNRAAR